MENVAQLAGRLEALDRQITLAINGVHSPASDSFWIFVSDKESWVWLYLVLLFLLFRRLGWRRALVAILGVCLCILATDQFANLIKHNTFRLRPVHDPVCAMQGLYLPDPGRIRSGLYGFFSAHAANTAAVAVLSSKLLTTDGKWRPMSFIVPVLILWTALVGTSRIFLGMHFFGDVLTGWIVGSLVGLLFYRLSVFSTKSLPRGKGQANKGIRRNFRNESKSH